MDNWKIGTIVKSIAGHDKYNLFVIINVENEYVYLVDGKCKTLSTPKKKKVKHVQFVADACAYEHMQQQFTPLLDAHIRKIIRKTISE